MQITKFSEFALRILIHLAVSGEQRRTAGEIAAVQGLSSNHLAKISQWLAAEGYIETTRGRGGGMTLARPASQISIGGLLRRSEQDLPLVECQRADGGHCVLSAACGLLPFLTGAKEAFFSHLDDCSLEDVVSGHKRMIALVQSLNNSAA